jgi:hypothetical protein
MQVVRIHNESTTNPQHLVPLFPTDTRHPLDFCEQYAPLKKEWEATTALRKLKEEIVNLEKVMFCASPAHFLYLPRPFLPL